MIACLRAALLALLIVAAPATAQVMPSDACRLHRAAPEAIAAEVSLLEAEATRIGGFAARMLADAAAMRLGPAREGVPGFGDWAYGWVQSYVTSYRILLRGMSGLAQSFTAEDAVPLATRIAEEMAEPIRAKFRARVLQPALGGGSFAEDLAHVGAAVDAAWSAAVTASAARIARLPAGPAPFNATAAARPIAVELLAMAPADPMALLAEDGADGGTVFLRSMRPMAARLGAFAVRLSEAGSLVAAGGAFGFALGGVPGTLVGLTGGIGASWGIDWLLNRLDATLNRAAFEAQAIEAIGRAERRLAEQSAAAVAALLAQRTSSITSTTGCP